MKYRDILHLIPVLVLILLFSTASPAQTTEFTYQGYLNDSSQPANGNYDFEFALFDALSGGSQIGMITHTYVSVSNGVFSVKLDFDDEFPGANRYLEIRVRLSLDPLNKDQLAVYTALDPRQKINSTPYAVKSLNATNATQLGGVNAGQFVLTTDSRMTDARTPISGSIDYIQNTTSEQTSSNFNVSGTGKADIFDATSQYNLGGNRVLSAAGFDNFFAGGGAGRLNTIGIFNSFFGGLAGFSNTGGSNNSFFGKSAGGSNIDGASNSFFGKNTGFGNLTGSNNSFFGRDAGNTNQAGSNNTLIGFSADVGTNNLTYATALGAGAVVSSSSTIQLGRADGSDSVVVPGVLSGDGSGLTNVPGTLLWQVVTGMTQQAQSNKGYVANDVAQVTITLPISPNIGDVVRVSGAGSGGWKIAQHAGQTILVTNLGLFGIAWTPRVVPPGEWTSVASSSDGTKLVAAVNGGWIYTSNDSGASWTERETNRAWSAVASSADGNKLVAVVTDGRIYTSNDSGASWTDRETSRAWSAVASSADGNKLVAVNKEALFHEGEIYNSTDSGLTWFASYHTPMGRVPAELTAVASSANGNKLVAVANGSKIRTSNNSGASWTERETNRAWSAVASSADGIKLVAAVNGGRIYTSNDSGASWTERETSRAWSAVASSADGIKLVAAVNGGRIYTSNDSGASWTERETNRAWSAVASSDDGSKLVAAVNGSRQIYTSTGTTTSGTTGYLIGEQYAAIELQYMGHDKFIPISYVGKILGN